MNMKYYNASNHFSAPIKREPKPYSPYQRRPEVIFPQRPAHSAPQRQSMPTVEPSPHRPAPMENRQADNAPKAERRSLQNLNQANLQADDLLLLGIIALLIWNSCDDTLLLLALGYLFFVGL